MHRVHLNPVRPMEALPPSASNPRHRAWPPHIRTWPRCRRRRAPSAPRRAHQHDRTAPALCGSSTGPSPQWCATPVEVGLDDGVVDVLGMRLPITDRDHPGVGHHDIDHRPPRSPQRPRPPTGRGCGRRRPPAPFAGRSPRPGGPSPSGPPTPASGYGMAATSARDVHP